MIIPSPLPLKCGRTYDQESPFFELAGGHSRIMLTHRDNTSLPQSEGGTSCGTSCTEQVTRLAAGARMTGIFENLVGFNVQGARTGEEGAGTLVLRACGQEIGRYSMAASTGGLPGFNNYPSPAWVPDQQDCEWSIDALGGFVDIRAVTTTCPAPTEPPAVQLTINGRVGTVNVLVRDSFTLQWISSQADSCVASETWAGARPTVGQESGTATNVGLFRYSITCTNAFGTSVDSVDLQVSDIEG